MQGPRPQDRRQCLIWRACAREREGEKGARGVQGGREGERGGGGAGEGERREEKRREEGEARKGGFRVQGLG